MRSMQVTALSSANKLGWKHTRDARRLCELTSSLPHASHLGVVEDEPGIASERELTAEGGLRNLDGVAADDKRLQ